MDPMVKAWAGRFERLVPGDPRFAQDVRALLDRLEEAIGRRGDFVLSLDDISRRLKSRDGSGAAALLAHIQERQRQGSLGHVPRDGSQDRRSPSASTAR